MVHFQALYRYENNGNMELILGCIYQWNKEVSVLAVQSYLQKNWIEPV